MKFARKMILLSVDKYERLLKSTIDDAPSSPGNEQETRKENVTSEDASDVPPPPGLPDEKPTIELTPPQRESPPLVGAGLKVVIKKKKPKKKTSWSTIWQQLA